jgi:hypothetical protein
MNAQENKEFTPYQFTQQETVKMIEHGSSLYMTDEEAWRNQPRWTAAERKAFLANLRLQMEQQERGSARIWEIDPSELDWLGWRLRLCPAPGCAFRLLIVNQKAQAQKLHPACKDTRRREQWRISKRERRAFKWATAATQGIQ